MIDACPFADFQPATLRFCEERLCAWVAEPANTWSNVGFFLVGPLIVWRARRERRPLAGLLGPIALLTGLASVLFHATATLLAQLLDLSAMYLETGLFITSGLARWRPWTAPRLASLYLALVASSIAIAILVPTAGIAVFAAHAAAFAALELRAFLRDRADSYRPLAVACALFLLSLLVWWLDQSGVVCDPKNHLFGLHAAWHLLGALSFWFWYQHLAQFERP
jgi:hypothetical protein